VSDTVLYEILMGYVKRRRCYRHFNRQKRSLWDDKKIFWSCQTKNKAVG